MKIAIFIILGLIILLLVVYAYFGGFKKINITISQQGGETVVYEDITGEYSKSGVVMDKIYYVLKDSHKIETYKGFGIYYDNPQKVEKSKLRSEAGCIIEQKDLDKLANIQQLPFKTKVLPTAKYITTEFPFKGKMSVMISLFKVYPALQKYSEVNSLNPDGYVMEIYDVPNGMIYYRKEIKESK